MNLKVMLDSLGILYPKSLEVWSDKNKKSPFEYAPFSVEKVYWKCHNSQHEDYLRSISTSNVLNFRCPECQYSKGENAISLLLNYNKINYIPQKTFKDLIGLGGGLLSYDFYLPDYNLLIEYQGEQHDRPVDFYNMGIKKTNLEFKKQLKHDQLKRDYALKHNINLLEIWYYDFDNIEEILNKELNL